MNTLNIDIEIDELRIKIYNKYTLCHHLYMIITCLYYCQKLLELLLYAFCFQSFNIIIRKILYCLHIKCTRKSVIVLGHSKGTSVFIVLLQYVITGVTNTLTTTIQQPMNLINFYYQYYHKYNSLPYYTEHCYSIASVNSLIVKIQSVTVTLAS